jgi:hypothetical protein
VGVPRRFDVLAELEARARQRELFDFQASRRARERRQQEWEYPAWVNVGAAGAPGFLNGWTNWTPANDGRAGGESYAAEGADQAGYFRDRWGFAHVRGIVTRPHPRTTAPIFQLPVELRPASVVYFHRTYKAYDSGFNAFFTFDGVLAIGQAGYVEMLLWHETVLSLTWLSLNDLQWPPADLGVLA